jgi:hypothetical protein
MKATAMLVMGLMMAFMGACGASTPKAPEVDTFDAAKLKDGDTHTLSLKFWMKERGLKGEELADNAHFDDGANNRVVFWVEADTKDAVAKLEQGKTYKVTFAYKASSDFFKGTLKKVE